MLDNERATTLARALTSRRERRACTQRGDIACARGGVDLAGAIVVHELAVMERVVDAVLEQVASARVTLVRLEIGELSGVSTHALRGCFDICTSGTQLDGAELDIVEIPGEARCRCCERRQRLRSFATPCTCGSFDRELVHGDDLRLVEVEVEVL